MICTVSGRGFNLSWSSTYLRLLPKRSDSPERKRHIQTVQVKLVRPEISLRKKTPDCMFAKSFMNDLFDVCELFGSKSVLVLSIDDKAGVKLDLAAASLQSPMLMSMVTKFVCLIIPLLQENVIRLYPRCMESVTLMKKVVLHTLVICSYVFAIGSMIHQHLSHTLMILEGFLNVVLSI